ncbi:MAG: cellulase family glycosylhydrolase [Bacteroidales bacterium]|nr:cellulase family glycosylhydrolase [Candidatus Physcousia equi]
MRQILYVILCTLCCVLSSCSVSPTAFVRVEGNRFVRGNANYKFVGTNFWYAPILASTGAGGNRQRLHAELDLMKETGISNVRVLVGAEGTDTLPDHIVPILQPTAGFYNDTLLVGLDYLLAELERRDMTAVLYLNNAWQWSGGLGSYLEWSGAGSVPPASDWDAYQTYHARFMLSDDAIALSDAHISKIVTRTSTVTGKPYTESPAIMAWELCNEPRPFSRQPVSKEALARWVEHQSKLIKSLDANHLVTTGSEGIYGCESDTALLRRIHAFPSIDYVCIHLWPHNWQMLGPCIGKTAEARTINGEDAPQRSLDNAKREAKDYIQRNLDAVASLGKPVLLEEFGYPRDNYALSPLSPTTARDRFYEFVLSMVYDSDDLAACNFWAWGGLAQPKHDVWQRWDDYTGDPAFEEQGLNAVFAGDTTIDILARYARRAVQNDK